MTRGVDVMKRADQLRQDYRRFWKIAKPLRKAVVDFPPGGNSERDDPGDGWDERVVKDVEYLDEANAISSQYSVESVWGAGEPRHMLLLDLDIPHVYVPSSTQDHGHLIIQAHLKQESMQEILDVLAKYNVIQPGFAAAAAHRKAAWLRVPWFKKWMTTPEIFGI